MLNTVLELEILAEWHMTKCIHLLKLELVGVDLNRLVVQQFVITL